MKVGDMLVTILIQICIQVRRRREEETTTTCGTIYVEEHVRCKCDCMVMESHCNPDRQVCTRQFLDFNRKAFGEGYVQLL